MENPLHKQLLQLLELCFKASKILVNTFWYSMPKLKKSLSPWFGLREISFYTRNNMLLFFLGINDQNNSKVLEIVVSP